MMHIHEKSIDYIKEKLVKMGLLNVTFNDNGDVEYKAVGWNSPANSNDVSYVMSDEEDEDEDHPEGEGYYEDEHSYDDNYYPDEDN